VTHSHARGFLATTMPPFAHEAETFGDQTTFRF
jgi:hypothetical protein